MKKEQAGKQEYKLRHILVKNQKAAEDLTASIKAKKVTFEAAAKKDSLDPGSGKNGGELGWGPATNYVPEFADAVQKLKKGEMPDKPVKTPFGWQNLQVDDTRDVKFPEQATLKPQTPKRNPQQK